MLEARLIGKFDIQCDGQPVILSSRAAQSLFAYLILTVGTLHRREKASIPYFHVKTLAVLSITF